MADTLEELGLEVKRNFFATGVVGLLKGGKPGKTLLIRADMDALPVQEENDLPYRSTCDGKMHACGHDAHTTWLLGTAMILCPFEGRPLRQCEVHVPAGGGGPRRRR